MGSEKTRAKLKQRVRKFDCSYSTLCSVNTLLIRKEKVYIFNIYINECGSRVYLGINCSMLYYQS